MARLDRDICVGTSLLMREPSGNVRHSSARGASEARYFPTIVEKSSDGYGVFFPGLPGCTSAGATLREAALNAEEALQAHIELGVEHGEAIPEPSTLDPEVVEAARILMRADPPGRTARVNITMTGDLLAAVDRFAVRTGYSRPGLLAQAVLERPWRDQTAA
jgi:predicted RNase H-like HicB family nuclease